MRSFEESLKQVTNPDHYLWCMIGSDGDDAWREREVEIRLDVPKDRIELANKGMEAAGWKLSSRPDDGIETLERVYWRRFTAVQSEEVTALLSQALWVADDCKGTLISWINVEDLEEN